MSMTTLPCYVTFRSSSTTTVVTFPPAWWLAACPPSMPTSAMSCAIGLWPATRLGCCISTSRAASFGCRPRSTPTCPRGRCSRWACPMAWTRRSPDACCRWIWSPRQCWPTAWRCGCAVWASDNSYHRSTIASSMGSPRSSRVRVTMSSSSTFR